MLLKLVVTMNNRYHLHVYEEDHDSWCPYCSYQKMKRMKGTMYEEAYINSIFSSIDKLVCEMLEQIKTATDIKSKVLITHPATRNLQDIEPYIDKLLEEFENSIDGKNLFVKTDQISFAQRTNQHLTIEDKLEKVDFNCDFDAINPDDYDLVIVIDDTYDSGDSYNVLVAKLEELGFNKDSIVLFTILEILSKEVKKELKTKTDNK